VTKRLRHAVRRTVATVAVGALIAGLTGCTGAEDEPRPTPSPLPGASTGTAPTLDAKPVPMKIRVTRVSGRLKKSDRASLEKHAGRTVAAYFDDAFLGGSYPRDDFAHAFDTFSAGAADQARRDRDLLTNIALGPSTEAVVPKEKKAWLSVLAPNKVAAGVTARIRLVYLAERAEQADQRVRVTGRLLLTRKRSGGWQVFGYDVAQSARPVGKDGS